MPNLLAFYNGHWIDQDQIRLAVDDIGFLQSATVVERMRTWNRRLPLLDEHLSRFASSLRALRIEGTPGSAELKSICHKLVDQSPDKDTGITLFATPGRKSESRDVRRATFCAHLTTLDEVRSDHLRREGQCIVITEVRQPSPRSWPRTIKVRSRLHYYLADQIAEERAPGSLGVLLDEDGSITETSISNVLICKGHQLTVPPLDRVLPGVTCALVCTLACEAGYEISRRPIFPMELGKADEVWLTSSEIGLWHASRIDDCTMPSADRCFQMQLRLFDWLNDSSKYAS